MLQACRIETNLFDDIVGEAVMGIKEVSARLRSWVSAKKHTS